MTAILISLAAVCDSDRAKAEGAGQPFGASAHINFRTMLEAERLAAITETATAWLK